MTEELTNMPISTTSGANPGESPYYNRAFWAAYKGMARGSLGGVVLGGAIGLAVGGVVTLAGAAGMLGAVTIAPLVAPILAGSTLVGMFKGKEDFAHIGTSAGAIAAAMEINEERSQVANHKMDVLLAIMEKQNNLSPEVLDKLQEDIQGIKDKHEEHYFGQHQSKQWGFWKVALVGAVAGLLLGGAIAAAGYFGVGHSLLGLGAEAMAGHAGATMAGIVATIIGCTVGGATYGINRHYFREVFNVTNALYDGKWDEIAAQRAQQLGVIPEVSKSSPANITQAQPEGLHPVIASIIAPNTPPAGLHPAIASIIDPHPQPSTRIMRPEPNQTNEITERILQRMHGAEVAV